MDTNIAHDIARIKAVLTKVRGGLGGTEAKLLDALLACWQAVSVLVQRQEHGSRREGTTLDWEDSRRLVFQAAVSSSTSSTAACAGWELIDSRTAGTELRRADLRGGTAHDRLICHAWRHQGGRP